MFHWEYMIELGDIFRADMAFEIKRDIIVERIRASRWYSECCESGLSELVDRLAETSYPIAFDRVWNRIYNQADWDRAWIETVPRTT